MIRPPWPSPAKKSTACLTCSVFSKHLLPQLIQVQIRGYLHFDRVTKTHIRISKKTGSSQNSGLLGRKQRKNHAYPTKAEAKGPTLNTVGLLTRTFLATVKTDSRLSACPTIRLLTGSTAIHVFPFFTLNLVKSSFPTGISITQNHSDQLPRA